MTLPAPLRSAGVWKYVLQSNSCAALVPASEITGVRASEGLANWVPSLSKESLMAFSTAEEIKYSDRGSVPTEYQLRAKSLHCTPPPSTVRGAKTKSMLCILFTLYFLWGSKMSGEAKIGFPEVTLPPTSPCHCSTSQLQLQPDCTQEALGAPRTQTVSRGPGCHKSSGMPLPPVAAPAFKHSHCLPALLCSARLEGHS